MDQQENTGSFRVRFPEVYERFFSDNDLVVSSPVAYSLNPALSWMSGGICAYQRLPFRGYLGLRATGGAPGITLGSVLMYSKSQGDFTGTDEELNYWEGGFEYLQQYIAKLPVTVLSRGLRVNLLLEQPENFGFETSLGTLLMTAVMLWFDALKAEDIPAIVSLKHKDFQNDNPVSKKYQELHKESTKLIRSLSYDRMVSGATVYKSIMDSEYPLIYFTEERGGTEEAPFDDLFPMDISKDLERFNDLKWWGFRLDEIAAIRGQFPLDMMGIFVGAGGISHLDVLEQESATAHQEFIHLQKFVRIAFSKLASDAGSRPILFLKELAKEGAYFHQYNLGQSIVGAMLLQALVELYRNKASTQAFQQFYDALNAVDSVNYPFVNRPSQRVRMILREIQNLADMQGVPIGVKNLSTGIQDRSVLVFCEKGKMRNHLLGLVNDLQARLDPKIHTNFVSWRDGWGKDGLKVEQFISKGIYSDIIKPNAVRLTRRTSRGKVETKIIDPGKVAREKFDLYLDLPHGKLYIAGKECISKEIPSQKAVVVIMDALLTAEGHRLHNRAFPESGYTKYRNEFQGKIIGPLVALVKKRLKKDLALKIEGTLTDFWVSLDPKGFEIGVVKKMG